MSEAHIHRNDVKERGCTRRAFLTRTGAVAAGTALPGSSAMAGMLAQTTRQSDSKPGDGNPHKKVIVLGIDGMDPRLCERLIAAGRLLALAKLRENGGYSQLGTSIPPQSPVAWANFITGAGPGVHGIFDFIHRDPAKQYAPYYAAAETVVSEEGWEVGDHRIPLTFWPFEHQPSQTLLRRGGTPFWDYLDEAGIPAWIYDIPSNYPPSPSRYGNVRYLSGMGVPDLLGSYGTYQFFSDELFRPINEGGGMRRPLVFSNDAAKGKLTGPSNTYLKHPRDTKAEFAVHRHPTKPVARIELQGQTIVLNEGDWSRWCKVDFRLEMPPFLPDVHVSGICRFYLQQAQPTFRLYASPINIDPSEPGDQRITEPADFVTRISDELDLFYTTGFQEDHKALANGVFTDAEFGRQADYVLKERLNLLRYAIDHYEDGLLFFYFSSTDLQAHMFWWDSDDPHPIRTPERARECNGVLEEVYCRLDQVVADVAARYGDEATLLVISDHGFANFGRQFNINRWLRDNSYIQPATCQALLDPRQVQWSQTRAYGLGINGIYLNLRGRERDGIVDPGERDALLEELRAKLLAVRDPLNGKPVIAAVHRTDEVYEGPCTSRAPDLIVGYARGYRTSWSTVLGDMRQEVICDNDSAWSADHCMDAGEVPGVVFSNRPIRRNGPALIDLAPTILEEFGLTPPSTMTGGSLFRNI
ncbi:MAG: alkaline phosphatase family protein [Planctomycetes bacterium]|nr:alkaline phosphatase family protein [Planctomycetota bacterium]